MKVGIDLTIGTIHELLTFDYSMTTVSLAYSWLCQMDKYETPPGVHVRVIAALSAKPQSSVIDLLAQASNFCALPQYDDLVIFMDRIDKYVNGSNLAKVKTDEQ